MDRRRFLISAGAGLSALALSGEGLARLHGESEEAFDRRMAWWREARFGMFVHWGVFSVAAGKWKGKPVPEFSEYILRTARIPVAEYETLADRFNPTRFDADEWASLARDAGMKYLVFTTKHHDGFCMFDSALTDWDIMRTPFKRDPVKELAAACPQAGVRFGLYHSILDWHHPDQEKNFPRYLEYMKSQLKELLTNYGEMGSLFFDGEWIEQWSAEQGRGLEAFIRELQPGVVINNRIGKRSQWSAMGGFAGKSSDGDYETPENTIPGRAPARDWETCMTMNDSWGYKEGDENWKSPADLIRALIECASLGGNFLLNVGPTAEGVIPEASVSRLREIGKWMRVNGESIYGTRPGPIRERQIRSTRKGATVYLHLLNRPGRIEVKLKERVKRAYLLSDPARPELSFRQTPEILRVPLPAQRPGEIVSVVGLEI